MIVKRFSLFVRYREGRIYISRRFLIFLGGFLFLLFVFLSGKTLAISLTCSINASNICAGTFVWHQQNDTGGFFNAHAQNITNSSFFKYSFGACCFSTSTLTNTCSDATVLRLANVTNSHLQFGNYSGSITYNYSLCLSANPGRLVCTYEINTTGSACVSAGYTCLGSMASSEAGDLNQTNSHVGPCSEYITKICCKINDVTVISSVILNATYGTNFTTENLTVYFIQNGSADDFLTNVTDWRKEGISIAVLNMPFHTNVSALTADALRDYSTFFNNGTLGGGAEASVPTWTKSGKVGGAYQFDGVNDYVNVDSSESLSFDTGNFTLVAWFNSRTTASTGTILGKGFSGNGAGYGIRVSTTANCWIGNSSVTAEPAGGSVSAGVWNMVVCVRNGTTYSTYLNGAFVTSASIATVFNVSNANAFQIGIRATTVQPFNGSADEVQLFNRSLSAAQISAMYRAGVDNHSVQMIHSDETTKGENWSVVLTPNDALGDGNSVTSNTLLIRNSLPVVTLTSPPDGNITTNRTPLFTWSVSDNDGDIVTSQFNLSAGLYVDYSWVCSQSVLQSMSVTSYSGAYLNCFWDRGYQYNWTVRANDSDGYGSWASVRRLNLTAVVSMTMLTNFIQFGAISLLQSNDTTDDSPQPFKIQNDGNSFVNVNVSATDLWQTVRNPNQYYRFKINNVTGEEKAFNASKSLVAWTNVFNSTSNSTIAIGDLNFTGATDSAEIDVLVQVPSAEPPGNRTSIMTFMTALAE